MALLSSFNEDRPVTYFRGHPIYCATILTIGYAIGVVLTTVLPETAGGLVASFIFNPTSAFLHGQIWQIFFCTFVNEPSFFILIGLFFLYISAVEVEKYIGRSRFLGLYSILLFVPIVTLTGWRLVTGQSASFFGSNDVVIGFFVAFCTLYPNLQWFGMIRIKWIAIISYAIQILVYVNQRDWLSALVLTLVCGASFGYIRYLQNGGELPRIPNPFELWQRRKFKVVARPSSFARPSSRDPQTADLSEMDRLLDKISKHGLASLTSKERETLERARAKLLEQDGK
jgi:membrane associated rhomboid family serine protease